jgi:protein TonB
MTMQAPTWFVVNNARDFARWIAAAAVVVCVHAVLVGGYVLWHQPDQDIGDVSSVVTVELAPIDNVADAYQRDVAPGPQDMIEQKATPDVAKEPDKPKVDQPPPPVVTRSDVALSEPNPPEKVEEHLQPAPRTMARVEGGAPLIEPTWMAALVRHLQQYKRYPSAAQAHAEQGVALLGFTVARNGHVLARSIVHSSGHADLDNEVMAMIERAQPLPAFPPTMPQAKLNLTVPIRFSLH